MMISELSGTQRADGPPNNPYSRKFTREHTVINSGGDERSPED